MTSRPTLPSAARAGTLALLLLLAATSVGRAQAPQERLALVRGHVLDPGRGEVIQNATVVVSGGRSRA